MHFTTIQLIGASIFSTAVGVAAGAYAAKRTLEARYDERLTAELEATKNVYAAMHNKPATPQEAVKERGIVLDEGPESVLDDPKASAAVAAMALYQGQEVVVTKGAPIVRVHEDDEKAEETVEETEEPEIRDIFVDGEKLNPDDFDLEEERLARKNGVPYVISQEEHEENEFNHEQVSVTYFAVDDTLCDEDERQIDDVDGTVGRANLFKFGHGSGDPVVVYVRNEARGMDYEVLRSEESYQMSVLGLGDDDEDEAIRHSAMPRRNTRVLSD